MPVESSYKVCPECSTEYLQVATRCSDCDVDLVAAADQVADEPPLEAFPQADELACVRVAPIAWIQALSGGLQERGHPHRVEPIDAGTPGSDGDARHEAFGDSQLFGLYVRADDLEAARDLDAIIAVQVFPEAAPDLEEGQDDACPACGSALAADATACSDCGLVMG
jgi:hypothetical protein